jgi:hypothetical protein
MRLEQLVLSPAERASVESRSTYLEGWRGAGIGGGARSAITSRVVLTTNARASRTRRISRGRKSHGGGILVKIRTLYEEGRGGGGGRRFLAI